MATPESSERVAALGLLNRIENDLGTVDPVFASRLTTPVLVFSPAAKLFVPLAAVKSVPAIAVPFTVVHATAAAFADAADKVTLKVAVWTPAEALPSMGAMLD